MWFISKYFFAVSFLFLFFLIYSIQYETHLITAKRLNCQVSVHKCKDKGKFAKKFVTSVITLNIEQIHFSGRDLLLLHSFFSKLLNLLKIMLCSVFYFNPEDCKPQTLPYYYFSLVTDSQWNVKKVELQSTCFWLVFQFFLACYMSTCQMQIYFLLH